MRFFIVCFHSPETYRAVRPTRYLLGLSYPLGWLNLGDTYKESSWSWTSDWTACTRFDSATAAHRAATFAPDIVSGDYWIEVVTKFRLDA